ncbi:enolase C-terminal domain-like protein [Streptomyces malaysiensis]|uniref:enolase C-terminal domain-like protein n=1 Tax=Streptomyces malaysiensis TaxID=92644 RepID=UPI0032202BF0|nr:muconate cycloisomerase [Streptomyces malaysiensis]
MNIDATVYEAAVPMRRPFTHAGRARDRSESVLLRLRLDGAVGWGEAAPRPYVTGETVPGVLRAFEGVDLPGLVARIDSGSLDGALASLAALDLPELGGASGPAPAAAAALETALLDAVCRLHGRPASEALYRAGLPGAMLRPRPGPVPVALVADLSRDPAAMLDALPPATLQRLTHVKVKATPDVAVCLRRLPGVRSRVAPGTSVSLDVNAAWEVGEMLAAAPALAAAGLSWIEEPTRPRQWSALRRLREHGVRVMLDESFADATDLARAAEAGAADLVNIRVSKCGGPLRAARLAARARQAGLGFQLGVQVGEVGPLWAAGRLLGTVLAGAVTVEAGRQDEWFPPELTEPAYRVDRARYLAPPLTGEGIGLVPTGALLERCRAHARWETGDRAWVPA